MNYVEGAAVAIGYLFMFAVLACLIIVGTAIACAAIFGPRIDHDILTDGEADQQRIEAEQDHAVDVWGCDGCATQAQQAAIRAQIAYSEEALAAAERVLFDSMIAREFGGAA